MSKINLFNEKNIILLNPFFLENVYDLIAFLIGNCDNIKAKELKEFSFDVISYYIDNELIYFIDLNQFFENKKFVRINISKSEIKELIYNKISSTNLSFEEHYFLPWFVFSDWYKSQLVKFGLTATTDWISFLSINNINLEQWIKENKE